MQYRTTHSEFACVAFIAGFRIGYSSGVADTTLRVGRTTTKGLYSICIPNGADNKQVATVFVKWANDNPTQWHDSISTGIGTDGEERAPPITGGASSEK